MSLTRREIPTIAASACVAGWAGWVQPLSEDAAMNGQQDTLLTALEVLGLPEGNWRLLV